MLESVTAAHRLDRGRVRRLSDWALRPGVISRRGLEEQRSEHRTHLTSALTFTMCTKRSSGEGGCRDCVKEVDVAPRWPLERMNVYNNSKLASLTRPRGSVQFFYTVYRKIPNTFHWLVLQ